MNQQQQTVGLIVLSHISKPLSGPMGIMFTASAIFQSVTSFKVGQESKYVVGVRLSTATYKDPTDTVDTFKRCRYS